MTVESHSDRSDSPTGYAPDWTAEQREAYKRAWREDRPVLLAHAEHDLDECDHCDLLRQLQREADEESA